jgi:hypothetical protein
MLGLRMGAAYLHYPYMPACFVKGQLYIRLICLQELAEDYWNKSNWVY